MGMFNEVFKTCPHCKGSGYMQIPQIVDGFGGFNLDFPENIAEQLSLKEITLLKRYVEQERFFICEDCKEGFSIIEEEGVTEEKMEILKNIEKK